MLVFETNDMQRHLTDLAWSLERVYARAHEPSWHYNRSAGICSVPEDAMYCGLVQFWIPSPVTQRRGERVQDHLSAHARRLVSFLANGYCACVHLAWQYGGSFEGIG